MTVYTTPARARCIAAAIGLGFALLLCACSERRAPPQPAPVYRGDIAELLAARCGRCHGAGDPAGGVALDPYLSLFACSGDAGAAAVDAAVTADAGGDAAPEGAHATAGSRLLAALERSDHTGLLRAEERARLAAWLAAGAPLREHGIHAPGILNPRSPDWHGQLAAIDRYAPLRDPARADACGRCHEGAPVRPRGVRSAADEAPACSDCHREPEGVLACGTCHGDGARRAAPPRDRCMFPEQSADAHAAHLAAPRLGGARLVCTSCHPAADASLRGRHGDGYVDIMFDRARAGDDARFDLDSRRCAVSCHDRGGAQAQPRFHDSGPFSCGDCHGSPPGDHFAGACDRCHQEPNADGSALRATVLHMNGRIDVGDGDPSCGSCHGQGRDPMPPTASHQLHRTTMLSSEIACSECHVLPSGITSVGHLDRGELTPPDVVFGPRARAFGQEPSYSNGVCRNIACHGAGIGEDIERALRWEDRGAQTCSGCHGLPPGGDHPQDVNCASTICHGSEVRNGNPTPVISASGREQHIDGTIDVVPR